MRSKIIGVSGVAGSGKDTFVELLSKKLPNVKRFALADALKQEINPTLIQQFGIDVFTCSREDKEKIRPALVAHGKERRMATEGRYWTDLLSKQIKAFQDENPDHYVCVTDIRYDFFEKDEVFWLKEELNGTLVHVSLYTLDENGEKVFKQPPNQDEAENDPKLIKKANYRVIWPKVLTPEKTPDFSYLNIYIDEFIKYLQR